MEYSYLNNILIMMCCAIMILFKVPLWIIFAFALVFYMWEE